MRVIVNGKFEFVAVTVANGYASFLLTGPDRARRIKYEIQSKGARLSTWSVVDVNTCRLWDHLGGNIPPWIRRNNEWGWKVFVWELEHFGLYLPSFFLQSPVMPFLASVANNEGPDNSPNTPKCCFNRCTHSPAHRPYRPPCRSTVVSSNAGAVTLTREGTVEVGRGHGKASLYEKFNREFDKGNKQE
ncbi:hypothetical protein L218DRAFT_949087 [Marasmius fiardii PR-910]|nr:hypothetical protein L218DRAFT_949087 [Marasmius fiardii PR-910]